MFKFGFTITILVVNAVINDPIALRLWVDIDARHKTDAVNDALFRTAPLSANSFNLFGVLFRDNRIIKQKVSVFIKLNIVSHRCPEIPGRDAVRIQQTIELIMTPLLCMIRKVRLCEVPQTC